MDDKKTFPYCSFTVNCFRVVQENSPIRKPFRKIMDNRSVTPRSHSWPSLPTGIPPNDSTPLNRPRGTPLANAVAGLWDVLRKATLARSNGRERATRFSKSEVPTNTTGITCLNNSHVVRTQVDQINTDSKPIHAHGISPCAVVPETTTKTAAALNPQYAAGQSPPKGSYQDFLHIGLSSGQGIFQFVSPKRHRQQAKRGDGSIIDLIKNHPAGTPLVVGGRYEVVNFRQVAGKGDSGINDDFVRYELEAVDLHDLPPQKRVKVPLTQVGLRFDGAVLEAREIIRASELLDHHQGAALDANPEMDSVAPAERLILSKAGYGRNATLITYRHICDSISDGTVKDAATLIDALREEIDTGRQKRDPNYVHSLKQLDELHIALQQKIVEHASGARSDRRPPQVSHRSLATRSDGSRQSATTVQVSAGSSGLFIPISPAVTPVPTATIAQLPISPNSPNSPTGKSSADRHPQGAHTSPPNVVQPLASPIPNPSRQGRPQPLSKKPSFVQSTSRAVSSLFERARPGKREEIAPNTQGGLAARNNRLTLPGTVTAGPANIRPIEDDTDNNRSSPVALPQVNLDGLATFSAEIYDVKIHTFGAKTLDMGEVESRLTSTNTMSGTHRVKEISGANADCWWRAAWVNTLLHHASSGGDPDRLGKILLIKLGPDCEKDAQHITAMIAGIRREGFSAVLTNMKLANLHTDLENPSRLKLPGLPVDGKETEGEDICRRLADQLLEKVKGLPEDMRMESIYSNATGDEAMTAALCSALGSDMVIFSRLRDANGKWMKDQTTLTVCAQPDSELRRIQVGDASPSSLTNEVLMALDNIPVMIHQGGHFNVSIPSNFIAVARYPTY